MRYLSPPRYMPLLLLLVVVPSVWAKKLVLANSVASRDYLEKRLVDGKIQPQTYVFMPDRFVSGGTRDRSLERFSFHAMAERLALDLRKQEFHPASSLGNADLLLVVHWGATAGRNRDAVALSQGFDVIAGINSDSAEVQTQLENAVSAGDFVGSNLARAKLDALASDLRSEQTSLLRSEQNPNGEDSAAILGLTWELLREDDHLADYERKKTMSEMTREECYFVVVMAYDARTLVSSRQLKRLWTVRVSMNTAGVNFPEALDRISLVASNYFGTRQERVTFDYPPGRDYQGTVEMPDIVVLGAVEPP